MVQSIVCCDSKQHIRHGAVGTFHGLIGVTLVVRKPEEFKKQFDGIINSFFKAASFREKEKFTSLLQLDLFFLETEREY